MSGSADPRTLLRALYDAAVDAADPRLCLPPHLPAIPARGRLILLAGGKAAASMTAAALAHYRQSDPDGFRRIEGLCVTRKGYGLPVDPLPLVEAGHPVPDEAGRAASARILALAASAGPEDRVLVLLSGGASANWSLPAPGLTLDDKQALTRKLLASGATIAEINTVRRHLSAIKGGRLARAALDGGEGPAPLLTLAISDVPGDDPAAIGSGPTVPDPTTLADARAVLDAYGIDGGPAIRAALGDPRNETPKPGDPAFASAEYRLVATPRASLEAAARLASMAGYEPVILGDALEGEAREVAAAHAALARAHAGRRAAILSGGELTVTIAGKGRGGPNQEYALALAIAIAGETGIAALAADTDGTDGGGGDPDDPAGAYVDGTTLARAAARGHDAVAFLADNDSTGFFEATGDLVRRGPTHTNVNDFRALLVDTPNRGA